MICLTHFCLGVTSASASNLDSFSDADWTSLGGYLGANGRVLAVVKDGSGNLYIGGQFTIVGNTFATNIAQWNGITWSALGSGMTGDYGNTGVYALAIVGSQLYAGGAFTNAGGTAATNIARWDGKGWSALASGLNNRVLALAVSETNLYAGGNFTKAGDLDAVRIAQWNGSEWSALGSGIGGLVRALAMSGTNLYAGGNFNNAGGTPANSISKWNGTSWSALGSGVTGGGGMTSTGPISSGIYALAVAETNLYVAGNFSTAGGISAKNIARWNGNGWSNLGLGVGETVGGVLALVTSNADLHVGGYFTTAGGAAAADVAKWDGNAWSTLGSGITGSYNDNGVYALIAWEDGLFAGGNFTAAGSTTTPCLAKWNGITWSPFMPGIDGLVFALISSGTSVYAGGGFTVVSDSTAKNVAKWDGIKWSALGNSLNSLVVVRALASSDTVLYAGSDSATIGDTKYYNIPSKWDGITWSNLGAGMNSRIYALAAKDTNLYAGGGFTNAGGTAANYIAQWDGNAWSPLGSGMNNYVMALAMVGTDLYAGGTFTNAGGTPANGIAQWDGMAWSALGSGLQMQDGARGPVFALAASGKDLYVGGTFLYAGGIEARCVAKWDGISWSALGSDIGNPNKLIKAASLAVSGKAVFVGGTFSYNGGPLLPNIARWNGSKWSVLGSGVNNEVTALAISSAKLYAGGFFTVAGDKVSVGVAMANIGNAQVSGGLLTGLMISPETGVTFSFRDADIGQAYRIQTRPSLTEDGWIDLTNLTYHGPTVITDSSGAPTTKKFYRAVNP